jgi:hypothetical protein
MTVVITKADRAPTGRPSYNDCSPAHGGRTRWKPEREPDDEAHAIAVGSA